MIVVVTLGLVCSDVPRCADAGRDLALLTLIILPPLFYRAGKSTGENLTRLRGITASSSPSGFRAGRADDFGYASSAIAPGWKVTELNWA